MLLHQDANTFNGQKRRVAFVHVVNGGRHTKSGESAQTANTEDNLLADALQDIAPVELIGNLTVLDRTVLRDIGIEKV